MMKTKQKTCDREYEWMDEKAAAEYLGYSASSLRAWRAAGKIITRRGTEPTPPCYRRAGSIWYLKSELDDWIRGGKVRDAVR